ncbi:MAG: MOSC domain-containing protein [Anaerolineae bacterium]|nr:MOSC domain-containing protein [Anaerolineae bacterium]
MTQIVSIVYKPSGVDETPNEFLRVDLEEANLIPGHGIEGDMKGGHPTRQLNIMSYETLTNLRSQGFYTEPGQMGEQIVIHQLAVDHLAPGTRLQLGEAAVVEVVKPREGCERFSKIQNRPLSMVQGQMGVIAKVVSGGNIRIGDMVKVLK